MNKIFVRNPKFKYFNDKKYKKIDGKIKLSQPKNWLNEISLVVIILWHRFNFENMQMIRNLKVKQNKQT